MKKFWLILLLLLFVPCMLIFPLASKQEISVKKDIFSNLGYVKKYSVTLNSQEINLLKDYTDVDNISCQFIKGNRALLYIKNKLFLIDIENNKEKLIADNVFDKNAYKYSELNDVIFYLRDHSLNKNAT